MPIPPEVELLKRLRLAFDRIERILVELKNVKLLVSNDIFTSLYENGKRGLYYISYDVDGEKMESGGTLGINWEEVEKQLKEWYIGLTPDATDLHEKIKDEILYESKRQQMNHTKTGNVNQVKKIEERNMEPIFPGKWRKEPYDQRDYIPLTEYIVASSLTDEDDKFLNDHLKTHLNNSFMGPALNVDDLATSEHWMVNLMEAIEIEIKLKEKTNETVSKALLMMIPTDHDVIRTQVETVMDCLLGQVQDKYRNDAKVLDTKPLALGKCLEERPVWGFDCHTRKMIEIILLDTFTPSPEKMSRHNTAVKYFIEKKLLPAINAQPPHLAHNISEALHYIINNTTSDERSVSFAKVILNCHEACSDYDNTNFRIHPKGTGVICVDPSGIPADVVIADYLGEMYPPYRWCEKLEVISQAQAQYNLKPILPEFYNILLERQDHDETGYSMIFVDASQKANHGSSCSHSCDANCTSSVVARDNKLVIVLTTNRPVQYGEELCMDYFCTTTSELEWRTAICLCGMTSCRGSFLHFATQDDLMVVLKDRSPPSHTFRDLLTSMNEAKKLDEEEVKLYTKYGLSKHVLGDNPDPWLVKYVGAMLRFINYERSALSQKLIRAKADLQEASKDVGNSYTSINRPQNVFLECDLESKIVMEQRLQSLVCCISLARNFLSKQKKENGRTKLPLYKLDYMKRIEKLYDIFRAIPKLLETHMLKSPSWNKSQQASENVLSASVSGVTSSASKTSKSSSQSTPNSGSAGGNGIKKEDSAKKRKRVEEVLKETMSEALAVKVERIEGNEGDATLGPICPVVQASTLAPVVNVAQVVNRDELLTSTVDDSLSPPHIHTGLVERDILQNETLRYEILQGGATHPREDVLLPAPVIYDAVGVITEKIKRTPKRKSNSIEDSNTPTPNRSKRPTKAAIRVADVIKKIKLLLSIVPETTTEMDAAVNEMRDALKSIADLSTPDARMQQLIDCIGMWIHTSNLIQIQEYDSFESAPITVVCRDLGCSEVNANIFKKFGSVCQVSSSNEVVEGKDVDSDCAISNAMEVEVVGEVIDCIASDPIGNELYRENVAVEYATVNGDCGYIDAIEMDESSDMQGVSMSHSEDIEVVDIEDKLDESSDNALASTLILSDAISADKDIVTPMFHQNKKKAVKKKDKSHSMQKSSVSSSVKVLKPNEPVFVGQKQYTGYFLFLQLMDWYNANSDIKSPPPDLFGSCILPYPESCFGAADVLYTEKTREILFKHFRDEYTQHLPWPNDVKKSFSNLDQVFVSKDVVCGSAFLDVMLGIVNADDIMLADMFGKEPFYIKKPPKQSSGIQQVDNNLAPEKVNEWVQCDLCSKWRRIPWDVNVESLPDSWNCFLSTWNPEYAYCEYPQDAFDPDKENIVDYSLQDGDSSSLCELNKKIDVFCLTNEIYYEAKIIKRRPGCEVGLPDQVLCHFIGWKSSFDEWIDVDSFRLAPHHLYTSVEARTPREQESWQNRVKQKNIGSVGKSSEIKKEKNVVGRGRPSKSNTSRASKGKST